jgi:hypoxia up-regulated 1
MGAMDTEVSIIRYSMLNQSAKKQSPHVEILSESANPTLGSKDIELVIVGILAERFNEMPERKGKEDVRDNVRAVKRIFKEALKIKEILSANKAASVKIPELLDYVTLKFELQREELEGKLTEFLAKVTGPIDSALSLANLTVSDIDQVELLGGGIRNPKIVEILEKHMTKASGDKLELGVHLNGDEAMCFGSAFIATNSSSAFKVK